MSATDQSNILNQLELSHNLRGSLQRAAAHAYQQSHREVTVEHLLLSLTEDRDAAVILEASNVEVASLMTEVADYLGRLDNRVAGDGARQPTLGRNLIHIFQSAAAAAQKSQRRAVGSALVLAAIVGEGRSPSAQMLRNHGLTFEQAIAALRQANAAQAARPVPSPAEEPPSAVPESGETPDASPSSAAPIPSGPAATPAPEIAPMRNVQAARDVLAGARERVAQMGSAAAKHQLAPETRQPAEPDSPALDAAPKPAAPDRADQAAAQPPPSPEPQAGEKSDQAATQPAPPPPAAAQAPANAPEELAKTAETPAPAPPPEDSKPDKTRALRQPNLASSRQPKPASAAQPGSAAPAAAAGHPHAGTAVRRSANRPPRAQPPVAGGPPPLQPARLQRRPRWPEWAQEQQSSVGADATRLAPQPLPPGHATEHSQPNGAGHSPSHPSELRAKSRQPGQASPPPEGNWQPRHDPTTRGEARTVTRTPPMDARAEPAHTLAQRPAPVPPPPMADLPPFEPRTLVEQVPTRMRAGRPLTINIRVPRRQLEAWSGGGTDPATLSQHVITKAMVMRLKAVPKDFSVENASPETQWSEGYGGPLSDDIVSWRWVVTPRRSGRHILQLSGSTRIVGRDGLAAERPLPPQRIPVRVGPDYAWLFRRAALWMLIAGLAGTLGYFADALFDMGRSLLAQLVR